MHETPDEIGPYRVIRPIAQGGMAEVYEVQDRATGEHMALKRLVQTGGALKRFNREYEAMIRVNHHNIVRVYHYGLHKGKPWFTMEMLDGTPLQAYAKSIGRAGSSGRLHETLRCTVDLLHALEHIHSRGLVHRDLKSANVLVLPDGRLKLVDFGTARVADAIDAITNKGEFVGTFAYASPEQILGRPLDHRSDLYSLGVLLYRTSTAKKPFVGSDPRELAKQHLKVTPQRPRERIVNLPPALDEVIMTLLEKDPANRFQDAFEVADALIPLIDPTAAPPPIHVATGQLVGREDETRALRRFLDVAEPASFALVVGTQGSGRKSLFNSLEEDCRKREIRTYSCFLSRDGDKLEALGTMLQAVGSSFGEDSRSDGLDSAMGHIKAATWDTERIASERADVLRQHGAKLLAFRAHHDDAPVVVLIHQLQHAGPVAFEVLVGLREALRRSKPGVLFIAHCVETADDPMSLARKRLPDAVRVPLSPLSAHQVALLVGSMLHRRPPPLTVARDILRATGGLPNYVEEVVQSMVEDGLVSVQGQDMNRIQWSRHAMETSVPAGATRRVNVALSRLPADRRRLLEALAVSGGAMSLTVLAGAMERTPDEIALAVDDVCNRGWVSRSIERGTPWLRWRQLLVEQVIIEQLRPTRRGVLERMLARGVKDQRPFAKQIDLLSRAGKVDDAIERGQVWCRNQLALDNPLTVVEVLEPLLERLDGADRTGEFDKARLYLLHAKALLMCRPADPAAQTSFARAEKMGNPNDPDFRGEVEMLRGLLLRSAGEYSTALSQLLRSYPLATVMPDRPSPIAANISREIGWMLLHFGKANEAGLWFDRARQHADGLKSEREAALADAGLAAVAFASGDLLGAEELARDASERCDSLSLLSGLSLALPVWVHVLRLQGRWSEAIDVVAAQLPRMRQAETPTLYVRVLVAAAWCELDLYRLGRAQEHVDELVSFLRGDEQLHLRLETEVVFAQILLASGDAEEAYQLLLRVTGDAAKAGLRVLAAQAKALAGEALWLMDDPVKGDKFFDEAYDELAACQHVPAVLVACVSRARVGAEQRNPDEVFEPVADFIATQPTHLAHAELLLAHARHARKVGEPSTELYREARSAIEVIAQALNNSDKASVRVHPMSRHLRIGMRRG
jgi:serine/threonine protein kinase/tetratricopeptide (TPR) repeat protein